MKELLQILMMTISGLLFSLGGWHFRVIRWAGIPILLGILLYFYKDIKKDKDRVRKLIIVMILLGGALTLPYGEKYNYLVRLGTAMAWILPSILYGWTIWQLITPISFIMMFWLSNNLLPGDFSWKIVESITGLFIGITYFQARRK